jgi:translation initiation factor IF-3
MSSQEAVRTAQSRHLDLVEISPNAKPPVCKIIDYGKYTYEKAKKDKLAKKNQVIMQVKEIRFSPSTDSHDVEFKTKHLHHFLMEGHKVKAAILFKGRMITHPEIGKRLMEDIIIRLTDIGKLESPPKMEGRQLIAYFVPDKIKIQAVKKEKGSEKGSKEVKEPQSTEIK